MKLELFIAIAAILSQALPQELQCRVSLRNRSFCGGGTEEQCLNRGCCYDEEALQGIPACYFPSDDAPEYSGWTEWEDCSVTCGEEGMRTRQRTCMYTNGRPAPSQSCLGDPMEMERCNRRSCPAEGETPVSEIVTMTPAPGMNTTTTEDPQCRDLLGTCMDFVRFCGTSLSFGQSLRRFCRRSCNFCGANVTTTSAPDTTTTNANATEPPTRYPPSQCIDEFKTCNRVADICTDPMYVADTMKYCRRTCNLCEACNDTRSDCDELIPRCSDPEVQGMCPRSCNVCDEAAAVATAATPMQAFSTAVVATLLTTTTPELVSSVLTTTRTPPLPPPTTTTTATTDSCVDQVSYCEDVKQLCDDDIYITTINLCLRTCNRCATEQETSAPPVPTSTTTGPRMRNFLSETLEESQTAIVDSNTAECEDERSDCPLLIPLCNAVLSGGRMVRYSCRKSCRMCSSTTSTSTTQSTTTPTTSAATEPTTSSATTTTTESTTTEGENESGNEKGPCDDRFDVCTKWVGNSLCGVLQSIAITCPESCNACDENGVNKYRTAAPATIATATSSTTTTTPAPTGCQDQVPSVCGLFVNSPACSSVRSLMVGCRKTCKLCEPDE